MNKPPAPAALKRFHRELRQWYRTHGRHDLPWRNTSDSYAIYVSEIMLQQTQVATVLERFYAPFLARFPSLRVLAEASPEAVLKAWEGLGYYTRARNLHEAARRCTPMLPSDVQALLALPGIGRNTAHAIMAFAHHAPLPVMEANVRRVLCRIFALETVQDSILWAHAAHLLDRAHPFDYNQAMMDLGAQICTPRAPRCDACPARRICQGAASPERYPQAKKKRTPPVRKRVILVAINPKKQCWITYSSGRFLQGLAAFPQYETLPASPRATYQELGQVTQKYSHFTLEAAVVSLHTQTPPERTDATAHGKWVALADLPNLALSRVDRKVVALLEER